MSSSARTSNISRAASNGRSCALSSRYWWVTILRTRVRTCCRDVTGLRAVAQGPKEGEDAVRASETHHEARSATTAGPEWRARRGSHGRGCAKLAKNGQAARSEGRKSKLSTCMKCTDGPRTIRNTLIRSFDCRRFAAQTTDRAIRASSSTQETRSSHCVRQQA